MSRLLLTVFSFFLALSALASGVEPPRETDRSTTLTIDELTIYSDASDSMTKSVATALERLRDALSTVTQLKLHSSLPMKVYIFNDRRTFVPFCDAVMGRSDRLSGVFL